MKINFGKIWKKNNKKIKASKRNRKSNNVRATITVWKRKPFPNNSCKHFCFIQIIRTLPCIIPQRRKLNEILFHSLTFQISLFECKYFVWQNNYFIWFTTGYKIAQQQRLFLGDSVNKKYFLFQRKSEFFFSKIWSCCSCWPAPTDRRNKCNEKNCGRIKK